MITTISRYLCVFFTLNIQVSVNACPLPNSDEVQLIQYSSEKSLPKHVKGIPEANIEHYIDTLHLDSYYADQFTGKSVYKKVHVKPNHSSFVISRDGGIWELVANNVTPEMFGARGNKSFDQVKLNDDTTAINKMIEYAQHKNVSCKLVSNYLHHGQINLPANITITGTGYATSGLYCTLKKEESAIVIKESNVTIGPFQVRAHLTEKKAVSKGHKGNCVVIGDFLTTQPQAEIHNINVNIRATRAPHNSLGLPSFTSPAINLIGNVRSAKVTCSIKGSKTPHSIGLQTHWGGVTRSLKEEPTISYHPCNVDVVFVDEIENCRIGVVNSSSYNINISPYTIIKPRVAYINFPGDNVNLFADRIQKPKIGRNINIGHITVKGVESHKAYRDIITITSRGTSKEAFYPRTNKHSVLQIPVDLTIDGFTITGVDQPVIQEHGCRISGVIGRVHLGNNCSVNGLRDASIEIENSYGDFTLGLIKADSPLKIEFSKGVRVTRSKITPAIGENQDSPAFQVIGGVTTISVQSRGRLVQLSKPLPYRLHSGDRILYLGGNHTISQPIPAWAMEILLDKIPRIALSEITISRRCHAKINVESHNALIGARIKLSDVTVSGNGPTQSRKYGYVIEEYSNVNFLGGIPRFTKRTVDGADFLVKANTGLNFRNIVMGSNNQQVSHFGLTPLGVKRPAKIHFTDSIIVDPAKLGIRTNDPNLKFIDSKQLQ